MTPLYFWMVVRDPSESILTLQKFAKMSGLKMNNDKTQIVWIGSQALRDMNFCLDPGIFIVLGIKFSTDTDQINEINYDNKLLEIKTILILWKRRQLTPLGKITVIKKLAMSDTQLRWFQARLLHGLLPTNRYLFILLISVYQFTRHISVRPISIFMGR